MIFACRSNWAMRAEYTWFDAVRRLLTGDGRHPFRSGLARAGQCAPHRGRDFRARIDLERSLEMAPRRRPVAAALRDHAGVMQHRGVAYADGERAIDRGARLGDAGRSRAAPRRARRA